MRRAHALVVTTVAALVLAGCSGGSENESAPTPRASASSAAPEPSAPPPTATPAPRPPAHGCYRLGVDAAVAPTSGARPRPCGRPHTAQTYVVGTLDTVVDGHLLTVDSARVRAQPARACPPRLAAYLGGSVDDLRLSMLRAVWFTPTVEQSDAGADWFRCDVIALAGNGRLARLDGSLAGVLGRGAGDGYAMCGTAEPGRPDFERVTCASPHSWRAVQAVPLAGRAGGAYPGTGVVRDAGQSTCKDVGQRASSDKLNFSWGYEWPTAKQWAGGQTYGLCWIPD